MAGTVVGARGSLAALALVAGETLALGRVAVADAAVGAFGVLVEVAHIVGGIDPRKLEGADALGAIARIVGEAHSPIVVAVAHAVLPAGAVSGAGVVAARGRGAEQRSQNKNGGQHFLFG